MAWNVSSTSGTKHVDIRCKHVNEYENGIVQTIFQSCENDSNILTKNLKGDLHEKHTKRMMGEKLKRFSRI